MSRRTGSRGKGNGDNSMKHSKMSRNTHEEVQRAIEGLKDIPDDELQEFLDDEEFMQGLNVVDAWEGDEEEFQNQYNTSPRNFPEKDSVRSSRGRNRRDHRGKHFDNRDQRDKQKRDGKKREELRRDPSKSSKDIERDKIRTKRDNEIKILAEKEKAIKHLLDSDTVVPPGTEVEAIENEKNMMDRTEHRSKKSKDYQRNSDRHRISPNRRRSQERIDRSRMDSLFTLSSERNHQEKSSYISPERNRSLDRHRKRSWEWSGSRDRRSRSGDRHRKRLEERDQRFGGRRSRSRERVRSRSRRRWSRSRSPARRKSVEHRRKRSPFINEIARQFRDEQLLPGDVMSNQEMMQQQQQQQHQRIQSQGIGIPMQQGMPMMNMPMQMGGPLGPPQHYVPPEMLGPPQMSAQPGYMPYDPHSAQNAVPTPVPQPQMPMNYDPVNNMIHPVPQPQPDYSTGPMMYNPPNPVAIHPQIRPGLLPLPITGPAIRSPQPVPAPTTSMDQSSMMFNPIHPEVEVLDQTYPEQPQITTGYPAESEPSTRTRLKTPEPPVISSNTKKFEKTSLSSLLEASVTAKDPAPPAAYPGFKPDILRQCELALRDLPDDDPRLKIKGRFFYNPTKDDQNDEFKSKSNSILLQKNNYKLIWDEPMNNRDSKIEYHQKSCQTDNDIDTKGTQTVLDTCDFCIQTCPGDLQPSPVPTPPPPIRESREEKRPIMDRLDWNVRDSFDYGQTIRESDDLRWSLNNSSQKRNWNRPVSPRNMRPSPEPLMSKMLDYDGSLIKSRSGFSLHHNVSRNSYSPERHFSPSNFRVHQSDYHDSSHDQRSREISPLLADNHHNDLDNDNDRMDNDHEDDEVVILESDYSRECSWRGRGKSSMRKPRSRSSGRSFRGRGGYRGKFQ